MSESLTSNELVPLWLAVAFQSRAQHEPNCSWSREACVCTCGLYELRLHLANAMQRPATEPPAALTSNELHQASAVSALELVDRLLAQAGYAEDASVRHNLAIGLSCIRSSVPPNDLLAEGVELVRAAIAAGDWKVDGACDPDGWLRRASLTKSGPYDSAGRLREDWPLDANGRPVETLACKRCKGTRKVYPPNSFDLYPCPECCTSPSLPVSEFESQE